jgi:hypothetical protein
MGFNPRLPGIISPYRTPEEMARLKALEDGQNNQAPQVEAMGSRRGFPEWDRRYRPILPRPRPVLPPPRPRPPDWYRPLPMPAPIDYPLERRLRALNYF